MHFPRNERGNYWAMWWGITMGLLFMAAATISFALDDRDMQASSARTYAIR